MQHLNSVQDTTDFAPSFRVVHNTRPGIDRNTCGQAAIATVLAAFRLGPFAAPTPPSDAEAIDAIRARFGPDLPFGLGTSAPRIARALRAFGVACEIRHGGLGARLLSRRFEQLCIHVAAGIPSIVCVDHGLFGGMPWSAHWAVVERCTEEHVWVGNCFPEATTTRKRFLSAWRCRHLPYGYNGCALLPRRAMADATERVSA